MVKNLLAKAGDARDSGLFPGKMFWSRKWHPLPVFLPGKFHGPRHLVGSSSPRGRKESDMTERLSTHAVVSKQVSGVP